MSKSTKDQQIVQSLLERLKEFPEETKNQEAQQWLLIRSVETDLQNLLNTRKPYGELPEQLKELQISLVNYGIPDLTTINIYSNEQKQAFCLAVQASIEHFEPRLGHVRVELVEVEKQIELIFRLRITASLLIEPEPIPVSFDSALMADTRLFDVKGQSIEEKF